MIAISLKLEAIISLLLPVYGRGFGNYLLTLLQNLRDPVKNNGVLDGFMDSEST